MTEKATQIARILAAKDSSFYKTVREPKKTSPASKADKQAQKVQKKEKAS